MKEKDQQTEMAIKALITFIPGIGGAMGSLLNDALEARKAQRINELLKSLKDEIDENKNLVNSNFISNDDFLDIFENIAKKIANERSGEKRTAYRNILLHGILSHNCTYDKVENQIRILEQLNADHILLLGFFNSPKSFNSDAANYATGTYLNFFKKVLPNWGYDYLMDHLHDLEIYRLIENISGNMQTMMSAVTADNFAGALTSKGKTFVLFILKS